MPSVVIKPDRDRDEYVIWSTVTESPHGFGDRAQTADLLRWGVRGEPEPDADEVLRRVDANGSSAMGGYPEGLWGDDGFIYHQAGWLARSDLFAVARMMAGDGCREWGILRLLTPLEDADEEREHLEYMKREYSDRIVSLEGERKLAGLAMRHLKQTIEGWNERP